MKQLWRKIQNLYYSTSFTLVEWLAMTVAVVVVTYNVFR